MSDSIAMCEVDGEIKVCDPSQISLHDMRCSPDKPDKRSRRQKWADDWKNDKGDHSDDERLEGVEMTTVGCLYQPECVKIYNNGKKDYVTLDLSQLFPFLHNATGLVGMEEDQLINELTSCDILYAKLIENGFPDFPVGKDMVYSSYDEGVSTVEKMDLLFKRLMVEEGFPMLVQCLSNMAAKGGVVGELVENAVKENRKTIIVAEDGKEPSVIISCDHMNKVLTMTSALNIKSKITSVEINNETTQWEYREKENENE
jgi:hypothetical protein